MPLEEHRQYNAADTPASILCNQVTNFPPSKMHHTLRTAAGHYLSKRTNALRVFAPVVACI
jgi:hypothetical protein